MLLCPHCLVIGPHADQDHTGHSIMSTIDGFRRAMEQSSESCKALDGRREGLRKALCERHMQLTDVHASFEEVQQQLDSSLRGVLEQLSRAQARRVEFLQSVKRQVLSQMLFLQWLENYQAHARLALPPSDYLVSARRHEHLVAALFGDRAVGSSSVSAGKQSAGDIGPMPPWMDEDLQVDGELVVWLISAPNPEHDAPEAQTAGVYPGGVNPLERGMMLEAAMGAPTGGVGAGVNVVPSGPGLFEMSAVPTGMLGFSTEGTAYLEAAPRGGKGAGGGGYATPGGGFNPQTAHGIGGPSDTMYARPPGGNVEPSGWPGSPVQPGQKGAGKGEFDSFISSALAYLDNAEQRITDGRTQPWAAGGQNGGSASASAGAAAAAAHSASESRSGASLQLSTEVLVELRAGGEVYGGPPGQWGCILTLLAACPSIERNELMLKALTCSAPFGDASAQLAKRVVRTTFAVLSFLRCSLPPTAYMPRWFMRCCVWRADQASWIQNSQFLSVRSRLFLHVLTQPLYLWRCTGLLPILSRLSLVSLGLGKGACLCACKPCATTCTRPPRRSLVSLLRRIRSRHSS